MTGSGLLAVLLWRTGAAPITESLARLGPALWLVVGVEFLGIVANTLSWRYAIVRERRGDVPFGRLIPARIFGDALNYVVPAGAGEIAKVRLLSRYITAESALASVVLARLTEGTALGVFGLLGLLVVWPIVAGSPGSTMPIAIAALAGAAMVVGSLLAIRFGLTTRLVRLFQRLGTAQLVGSRLGMVAPSASVTASVEEGRTGSVLISTGWHLAGWLVNVAELWLACHFLELRPTLGVVFGGEALGALCDGVFFLVPMKIGVAEGGRMFVFTLLGLTAAQGLTLGLVRRVRELTWTAVGLAICPWLGASLGRRKQPHPDATAVSA